MTTYYTKGEDGEYSETDVDSLFKDRHERWVKTESDKIRQDVEKSVRDELTPTIEKEVTEKVTQEFQPKLNEAESNVKKLETSLRQKTIAAEYGFKPGSEKYLGEGSEEEMRKEADTLKNSFGGTVKSLDKETGNGKSKTQERTGISVTI